MKNRWFKFLLNPVINILSSFFYQKALQQVLIFLWYFNSIYIKISWYFQVKIKWPEKKPLLVGMEIQIFISKNIYAGSQWNFVFRLLTESIWKLRILVKWSFKIQNKINTFFSQKGPKPFTARKPSVKELLRTCLSKKEVKLMK